MTVSDIVEQLGGTTAVAEMLGVGPSAVSNWKAWNRFPPRVHYRIYRECERRKIDIDESLFDDSPNDDHEPQRKAC